MNAHKTRVVRQADGSVVVGKVPIPRNFACAAETLRDALKHEALAGEQLEAAVLHARLEHEWTWQQVADEIGLSRQAVQKRYAYAEQLAESGLADADLTPAGETGLAG